MKTILKRTLFAVLVITLLGIQQCSALSNTDLTTILTTDFSNGTVAPWGLQANPEDITVVVDPVNPSKKVMKAHININEDFSKVCNGAPRAEILDTNIQLVNDSEYLITFKTYLPKDFQIETASSNPHIFFQVHQNISTGSPQLAIQIDKNNYILTSNSSDSSTPQYKPVNKTLGTVSGDLGKWTDWTILYDPAYNQNGRITIWKNGMIVLNYNGVCAYNGITGYPKFGIYKWNWELTPTTTTDITTYFSDLQILKRK